MRFRPSVTCAPSFGCASAVEPGCTRRRVMACCLRLCGVLTLAFALAPVAAADDRAACSAGDRRACARIGELKRNGALNADGTKNVDRLIDACAGALDAATGTDSFRNVSSACKQLFNAELQRGWDALAGMQMPGTDALLATAYAEAYCPNLPGRVAGCAGKKAANFSRMKSQEVRSALSALNAAALDKEVGAEKAKALTPKFALAWPKILGAPR